MTKKHTASSGPQPVAAAAAAIIPSAVVQRSPDDVIAELAAHPGVVNPAAIATVLVSPLPLLRITSSPTQSGILLGLDNGAVLEVTHAFALPAGEEPNGAFAEEMVRALRDVNVDANIVGWYLQINGREVPVQARDYKDYSAGLGAWCTPQVVEQMAKMQRAHGNSTVLLVHDASKAAMGQLAVSVHRLYPSFLQAMTPSNPMHPRPKFTTETIRAHHLNAERLIDSSLRVGVRADPLTRVLLHHPALAVVPSGADQQRVPLAADMRRLALSGPNVSGSAAANPLHADTASLLAHIDAMQSDHGAWMYWHRGAQRELSRQSQALSRRRAENVTRAAQGLPLLPEDDVGMERAKTQPEPERFDAIVNAWLGARAVGLEVEAGAVAEMVRVNMAKVLQS